MRQKIAGAILVISILAPAAARAQSLVGPFRNRGKVAISVERLFGYAHTSSKTTLFGNEVTNTFDNLAVAGNPVGGTSLGYSWPRLALDGLLPVGVTIGGSAAVFSLSQKPQGAGTSADVLKGFQLGARVGFAYMFVPATGIWPRAGVTYVRYSNPTTTTTAYAVTLEAPLVFALSTRAAFLVAPTFDFGLGGSTTNKMTNMSVDTKTTDVGLQLGLLAFL